jgi:predicted dinucleotide-binding enzyme
MKIGILGSGAVGRVLGAAFIKEGYEVILGTRDVNKEEVVQWKKQNPGATAASFADAAKFGELLVLAVAGSVAADVLKLAGAENIGNKIVIDVSNPIAPGGPTNNVLHYFTTLEESLMEQLQKLFPDAKFVMAFNSVGNAVMYKPHFAAGKPSMFICGNDEAAKKTVTGILTVFGWETEDMGGIEAARAIEPLCILWCIPGFRHNQWSHAFKLLKV